MKTWQHGIGIFGFVLLALGTFTGLTYAPPERHMGDVSRILYAHVPSAWNTLLILTFVLIFAVASLWTGRAKWDNRMVAAIEVGCVLSVAMLLTGSIFARPTWGVWWDWDIRLTTSLLALILFVGVLALRSFIPDPQRRATWSATAAIFAWVDIPLIYFCVRWWRSLHQVQSSPDTVSAGMVTPLRINAFAILFIATWLIMMRTRIEEAKRAAEEVAPPERITTTTEAATV